MPEILKKIIKIILIPIIILIKALFIVIGELIKLLATILMISSSLFFVLTFGFMWLVSSVGFLGIIYIFIMEKDMNLMLPFIILTVTGALGVIAVYNIHNGINIAANIGTWLVIKAMSIPIWKYWH